MEITLPAVPLGILTLLAFFTPFAASVINGALTFVQGRNARRIVSVLLTLVLTAVVIAFYYGMTGDTIESWWAFALIAIMVAQSAWSLLFKKPAEKLEATVEGATAK